MPVLRFLPVVAAAFALALPSMAAAPGPVKARQDNFKAIGRSMKILSDELRKPAPALAIIRSEAATLERAGKRIAGLFPQGSGPAAGVHTEARAEIWAKPAEFRAATAKLNGATKALRAAAAGTDPAKIRAAMVTTRAACKGCHEKFRLDQ